MQLKSSDKEVLATKSGFDSLKDIAMGNLSRHKDIHSGIFDKKKLPRKAK